MSERDFFMSGPRRNGASTAVTSALADVEETFKRWLYIEDMGAVYVTLAAIVGNHMPGDPLWLMLIGGSSSGKTESLMAGSRLPDVHLVSTLTEAGLLSATPKREKDNQSTGGVLREVGDFGVVVCKDFTSVLAMHYEQRRDCSPLCARSMTGNGRASLALTAADAWNGRANWASSLPVRRPGTPITP
jgi:hypothetical protein